MNISYWVIGDEWIIYKILSDYPLLTHIQLLGLHPGGNKNKDYGC